MTDIAPWFLAQCVYTGNLISCSLLISKLRGRYHVQYRHLGSVVSASDLDLFSPNSERWCFRNSVLAAPINVAISQLFDLR